MNGAMSQMDTWDYKPQLQKDDGKVGPAAARLAALEVQVPPAWRDRHLGLGTVSRTSPSMSTSSASSAVCTPTRRPIPKP